MRALSGTALTRTHVGAVGSLALALSGRPAQSWAVETDRSPHRFHCRRSGHHYGMSGARSSLHAAESTPARVGRAVTPARPPYAGYAAILAAFGGALAASAGLERALGRQARPASHLDFLVLCAGSFKAARALSRERIGSVLRQPFVESETREGVGLTHEDPAGEGLQRALGELVTCTRCAGTWTAAGLLTCQAVAPRFGQLLTWSLAAGAGNDFLQAAFAALIARELPGARETSVADPTSRGLSSEHIARDVVRPRST